MIHTHTHIYTYNLSELRILHMYTHVCIYVISKFNAMRRKNCGTNSILNCPGSTK